MGIWNFIVGLFGYVMQFCYSISFDNYALALLFYALFFKLLLLPFSIKQQKSSIKMAALRPKMALIEKKYAGRTDRDSLTKKQQEMMELQQREGYSPFSGCLPLLIQMPVIIALYEIIRKPLTFISHLSQDVLTKLSNIFGESLTDNYAEMKILSKLLTENNSEAAALVGDSVLPKLTLWGINFGETPSFTNPGIILIIPFLVFGAQLVSMWLMQKWNGMSAASNGSKEAEMSNKIMLFMMPLMTLFFAFNFSAAIGVYWIYQSLLGLLQSFILSRVMPVPQYTAEQLKAMEKEAKAQQRSAMKTLPKSKSLHHIDDDDDDDMEIPAIRSKYGDEGDSRPVTTVANPMSNTQRKKTNKSKKHKKK